jgi:hypothetical protein
MAASWMTGQPSIQVYWVLPATHAWLRNFLRPSWSAASDLGFPLGPIWRFPSLPQVPAPSYCSEPCLHPAVSCSPLNCLPPREIVGLVFESGPLPFICLEFPPRTRATAGSTDLEAWASVPAEPFLAVPQGNPSISLESLLPHPRPG